MVCIQLLATDAITWMLYIYAIQKKKKKNLK